MEGFLLERYWPGVTAAAVGEVDARLAARDRLVPAERRSRPDG